MRLLYVIRKDLEDDRKSLVTYILTIMSIVGATALIEAIVLRFNPMADSGEVYSSYYYGFLYLGGMIFTSLLFREDLFKRVNTHLFLMLPASPFEKFLSRALMSAIIYPVALTVLFTGASLIIEPLFYLIFGNPITLFNPLAAGALRVGLNYFSVTSIFFLGSVYFRKTHFFKTIFSSIGIALSFGLITALLARIIFAQYCTSTFFNSEVQFTLPPGSFPLKTWEAIGNIFYFVLLPLFCYTVAFLKLKEVEATDAVS